MSRVEFGRLVVGRQDAHPTHKITLFPIAGGVGKIETDTLHAVVVALRWLAVLWATSLCHNFFLGNGNSSTKIPQKRFKRSTCVQYTAIESSKR